MNKRDRIEQRSTARWWIALRLREYAAARRLDREPFMKWGVYHGTLNMALALGAIDDAEHRQFEAREKRISAATITRRPFRLVKAVNA